MADLGKSGELTEEKAASWNGRVKEVRAPMKMLRYLFEALSENHEALESNGDPEWRTIANFLLRTAEELGDDHGDCWERAASDGDLDYKKDKVKVPSELSDKILDFADRVRF
jgi:hypothetical protein